MRPLQEVLVDLVLDESIKGVTNFLCLRIFHQLCRLDVEALLQVAGFVLFSLAFEVDTLGGGVAIALACFWPTVGVIAILKLVRVNEVVEALVLGVGLHELIREIAFQGLCVG